MYIPLRNHGWHSLLTGIDPPELLLARAAQLELPALALTDVDTLSGSTSFLQAASSAVRPILGAEISDPMGRPGRLIALVRTPRGYANLCKLVSARQLGDDPGASQPNLGGPERFDPAEAAGRFQEGLTFLVDHPRLLLELAPRMDSEHLHVAISPAALTKRGPASGAIPKSTPGQLDAHKVPAPSWSPAAGELLECARALGLATLAVPDVYWTRDDGFEHHRVRTAIKHNALACDLPRRWLAELPAHLPSSQAMQKLYRELPDVPGRLQRGRAGHAGALLRTLEVGEACRFVPQLGGVLFPEAELRPGETPYSQLCCLAFEGARKRFNPLRPEVIRRLDYELAAIEELGFAPYFLLVHKIADFAREQKIPHVGRGSAADSLVAYCLELTDADPLRYNLPFERFLNPARSDRPDIDLDFSWRRRDEVLAHVWQAFGAERTAMISTLNRFGLRAAFREAALAAGIPPVEVNRWSKRLPWMTPSSSAAPHDGSESSSSSEPLESEHIEADFRTKRAAPADSTRALASEPSHQRDATGHAPTLPAELAGNPIAQAFRATPECRGFPFLDQRYAFILRMAEGLLETPRHLGLHPGGVVVAPGPITDVVSCQRATKGVLMTQLDKHGVEALGLVKMDLLGNRALTVIEDCLLSIKRTSGIELDLRAIPEQEPRTQALLTAGSTLGCFQVESPGMRHLLQQIAARNMDDVIQAVALIRPGPSGSGMKDAYIRRFRGLEEPLAPHPRLTEMLAETHGVMLYQEDVMQAVVLLAGMDLSSADELRRALAKRRPKELARLRQCFFDGCAREGIQPSAVKRIWELIANFSSFGFCKAHAVTYGQIAYRTVYLKAHYPAAYLTAFLNSQTGYYEARVYVEEARRLGAIILAPDVNRSQTEFSLEAPSYDPGTPGQARMRPAIRVGLDQVKGLSESTQSTILEERQRGGAFLSLPDFLARTGARVDEIERLIQCGAFDAFDRTRPEMLWRLHLFATPTRRVPGDLLREAGPLDQGILAACHQTPDQRARGWSQPSLGFGAMQLERGHSASLFPEPETPALALPALPDTDPLTRGRLELELLGLTIHAHPTELFPCSGDGSPSHWTWVPCAALAKHAGKRVLVRGWLAASRRVRTSDGRWMRFLTLEDTSGLSEVVLFADVYEHVGHKLTSRGPYRIFGRVENHLGSHTLHAEGIQ